MRLGIEGERLKKVSENDQEGFDIAKKS